MTFGEKLRDARQKAGLSQEQLSEKLHVSRSAVAKWETNKGLPDIENLKAASQLLNVSIDYLLDDGETLSFNSFKEAISLDDHEKSGNCRSKQDAAAKAKFPQATQIYPLIKKKKLSTVEKVLEWTVMPAFGNTALPSLAVLGEISISGSLIKAEDLANSLQVCLDSGAKKVLLPITSAVDLGTVPPELMGNFSIIFYQSAEDAVFKALGVE